MRHLLSAWGLLMITMVTLVVSMAWFLVLVVIDATVPGIGTWILCAGALLGAGLFGVLVTNLRQRSRRLGKIDGQP